MMAAMIPAIKIVTAAPLKSNCVFWNFIVCLPTAAAINLPSGLNKQDFLKAIQQERAWELSGEGMRRADLTFSLSYDTNIKVAKDIVMQVMQNHPNVLKTPEPSIVVKNLTDSAIQIGIRPWSKNEHFAITSSDILEQCKDAFDKAGISIQPFVKEVSRE